MRRFFGVTKLRPTVALLTTFVGSWIATADEIESRVYAVSGIVCEAGDYGVASLAEVQGNGEGGEAPCIFPAQDVKITLRVGERDLHETRSDSAGRFVLPDRRESDEDACIRFEAEGVNPYTTCYRSLISRGVLAPGRNELRVELLSSVFDYEEFSPSQEHGSSLDAGVDPWASGGETLRGFLQANFDALDVLDLNGERITRESLAGQWVLIEFWATWCGFCRKEIPHLREAYEEFKDHSFEMIGISLDQIDGAAFRSWIGKQGMSWRQVLGENAERHPLGDVFRVVDLPRSFLVDPNGRVVGANLRSWRVKHELKRRMGEK